MIDKIKIKNISAGMLYDVNLGIRDYFTFTDAILHQSLFSEFLQNHGMQVTKNNYTRDIICLDFDFGSRSYEDEERRIVSMLSKATSAEEKEKLEYVLDRVRSNKDKYDPKTNDEIRDEFYQNDVTITYSQNNSKNKSSSQTYTYTMLYRTSAKAKLGQAVFIKKELYDRAYNWLTMGIGKRMGDGAAKIVELSAYAPLTTSTIIDKVHIPVENIVILKDQDSVFRTLAKVVSAEPYQYSQNGKVIESKRCVVETQETDVKNTLWDGMGLIDDSLFSETTNGMMLLRNHFFKMCGFRTNIKTFFRDWCKSHGEDYNTYQIQDMFGQWHYVSDIQIITTDNSIKWKKFVEYMDGTLESAYGYWCDRIRADGCMWGIVKTDHPSKLGSKQQMSYQMLNTLPCDKSDIIDILEDTITYVSDLKTDPDEFERFLRKHANAVNHYEMLADLYEHNYSFADSQWFRNEKKKVIASYVSKLKSGKIMVEGDNLTVCGNPYALLLYAAGEDWSNDPTLKPESGVIQCYTPRFQDDTYLAAFRNPHNSPNNIMYFHNVYSREMKRYFPFSSNILAVNCIHTDVQDRSNGCDFDSDFFFVTNQCNLVSLAKKSYEEFPTIVNHLRESGITYENTRLSYAQMDNKFSKSRLGIGWSSNLAQLAMTYYWTELSKPEPDQEQLKNYYDNFVILSVLAQVIIDGCKREYEIDGMSEIKRIQHMQCMNIRDPDDPKKKKDFPSFMKYTRDVPLTKNRKERDYEEVKVDRNKLNQRINENLICPMNWVDEVLSQIKNAPCQPAIDTIDFFISMEGKANDRQITKIRKLVDEYSNYIDSYRGLLQSDPQLFFENIECKEEELIRSLRSIKIRNIVTINRLVKTSLGLSTGDNLKKSHQKVINKHQRKVLNALYKMDKNRFLLNFACGKDQKNAEQI